VIYAQRHGLVGSATTPGARVQVAVHAVVEQFAVPIPRGAAARPSGAFMPSSRQAPLVAE